MQGIKLVFPNTSKNKFASAVGAKIFVVDANTGEELFEIKSALSFAIPKAAPDNIVSVNVEMALFSVEYQ